MFYYNPQELNWLSRDLLWPGLLTVITMSTLTWILSGILRHDPEEPGVPYSVPIPEQCTPGWKGEELDKPQLRVTGSRLFHTPKDLR